MSSTTTTANNTNAVLPGSLTLRVSDAQTSAENGRKFTKYKVIVNYNGQEWEIWRRYKEFHTLNEKVSYDFMRCFYLFYVIEFFLASSCSF